jgi:hypothetical protein
LLKLPRSTAICYLPQAEKKDLERVKQVGIMFKERNSLSRGDINVRASL